MEELAEIYSNRIQFSGALHGPSIDTIVIAQNTTHFDGRACPRPLR